MSSTYSYFGLIQFDRNSCFTSKNLQQDFWWSAILSYVMTNSSSSLGMGSHESNWIVSRYVKRRWLIASMKNGPNAQIVRYNYFDFMKFWFSQKISMKIVMKLDLFKSILSKRRLQIYWINENSIETNRIKIYFKNGMCSIELMFQCIFQWFCYKIRAHSDVWKFQFSFYLRFYRDNHFTPSEVSILSEARVFFWYDKQAFAWNILKCSQVFVHKTI